MNAGRFDVGPGVRTTLRWRKVDSNFQYPGAVTKVRFTPESILLGQSRTDPSTPRVGSDSVTSDAAEFDPVLRAPLPQSRLLGLVRKIVPPFEGAPLHEQLLISAVSTSSTEDVANFVVVVG